MPVIKINVDSTTYDFVQKYMIGTKEEKLQDFKVILYRLIEFQQKAFFIAQKNNEDHRELLNRILAFLGKKFDEWMKLEPI